MSWLLIAALVLVLLVLGSRLIRARRSTRRPQRWRSDSIVGDRERAIAAQFEVEEHDIDEMLEAQTRLRKRIGKRSLGDVLADEALRPHPEEEE